MFFFPVLLLDFFESSRLLRCIVGRRLESQKTVLMVGICEEKFKALSHVIQLVAQTFGVAAWSDPLICLVCFEDEAAVITAAVTAFRSRCLSLTCNTLPLSGRFSLFFGAWFWSLGWFLPCEAAAT